MRPTAFVSIFFLSFLGLVLPESITVAQSGPMRSDLARAGATEGFATAVVLDEVLVTGEQPGPNLWRVSKGQNVLWLLAILSPLPDRMAWRSKNVEAVIRESQEVVAVPRFVSRETREYRRLMREFAFDSGGRTLSQVLPPDVDSQFSRLVSRYAEGSYFQEYRPFIAVQELYRTATERSGLSSYDIIGTTVQRLAKRHGVTYNQIELKDDQAAGKIVKEILSAPETVEIECVKEWMTRFDRDLRNAIARANDWARGDLDALRADVDLYEPQQPAACEKYFSASKHFRRSATKFENLRFKALEKAMRKNRSTLALVEIERLLDHSGLLSEFRARGYTVEEP